MRHCVTTLLCAAAITGLAACSEAAPTLPEAQETAVPEELQSSNTVSETPTDEEQIGTPMAERVATIGLLNKRNNVSQDLEMKPGESRRLGDVIIRLSACERTPSWEMPKETGAFVQVLTLADDQEDAETLQWKRVFSGWLFKNSPSLNVVEDPVYDVWVKDCAMSFPGEVDPEPATPAPSEPAGEAAPAPEPSAEAPATNET